jgi:hypothetical protein
MKQLLFNCIIICFLCKSNYIFGQNKIKCNDFISLINFSEIQNNFRGTFIPDTIILVDKELKIESLCASVIWGSKLLIVSQDTLLIKKSIKGSSSFYFNGDSKYFVLSDYKKKGKTILFTLYRANTNEFIDCKIITGSKLKFFRLSSGVY